MNATHATIRLQVPLHNILTRNEVHQVIRLSCLLQCISGVLAYLTERLNLHINLMPNHEAEIVWNSYRGLKKKRRGNRTRHPLQNGSKQNSITLSVGAKAHQSTSQLWRDQRFENGSQGIQNGIKAKPV